MGVDRLTPIKRQPLDSVLCEQTGERRLTREDSVSILTTKPTRLRLYKCVHCDRWHLTSKDA
jgi:hypothetical protein